MPKRILDGEAMWNSTKLSQCPEWAITYYPWLYPLADANGSFEMSNLRVLWCKVAAILPNFRTETLVEVLHIFEKNGLLFTWLDNGKQYGHWTGSEKEGRLPMPSRRGGKYGRLFAPPVPEAQLLNYQREFSSQTTATQSQQSLRLSRTDDCDLVAPTTANGIGIGIGIGIGLGLNPAAKPAAVPPKRSKTPEEQKQNVEARNERLTQETETLRESIVGSGPGTEVEVQHTIEKMGRKMSMTRPLSEAEFCRRREDQKKRLEEHLRSRAAPS